MGCNRFWVIWKIPVVGGDGNLVSKMHYSKQDAVDEATRLAKLELGHTFVVLESKVVCKALEPTVNITHFQKGQD
jgi:hypothetical protein